MARHRLRRAKLKIKPSKNEEPVMMRSGRLLASDQTSEHQEIEFKNHRQKIADVGAWTEMANGTRACGNRPDRQDAGSLQVPETWDGARATGDEVDLKFLRSEGGE